MKNKKKRKKRKKSIVRKNKKKPSQFIFTEEKMSKVNKKLAIDNMLSRQCKLMKLPKITNKRNLSSCSLTKENNTAVA